MQLGAHKFVKGKRNYALQLPADQTNLFSGVTSDAKNAMTSLPVNPRENCPACPVSHLAALVPRSGRRLPPGWPSYLRPHGKTSATAGSRPPAFQHELHARPQRALPRAVRRVIHERACLYKWKALVSKANSLSGQSIARGLTKHRFPKVAFRQLRREPFHNSTRSARPAEGPQEVLTKRRRADRLSSFVCLERIRYSIHLRRRSFRQ
jgi:hypothetical protein